MDFLHPKVRITSPITGDVWYEGPLEHSGMPAPGGYGRLIFNLRFNAHDVQLLRKHGSCRREVLGRGYVHIEVV